jgi:MarR family transcriptional regulator for hemolysin
MGVEGPSLVRILDQLCQPIWSSAAMIPPTSRAKTLHLTAEGEALAVVVEDAVQVVRAQMLADVSDVNLATTLRAFTAFEAALDAAPGQGS